MKGKATRSVFWSAIERFSVQGIQFLLTIIIARLVSPSDYGLIAMLGIFLAIAQAFIDSGFSNALIQKQDRTNVDFYTVFYFNIIVGFAVYILLYIAAPYIAAFYDEPKLNIITKIVSVNLIISSFSVIQRAILTIELNFKKQATASLIAVMASGGVGVYLAYIGYGVWAIIIQTLLNTTLNTIMLWIVTDWIPKLEFSYKSFRTLFSFGSKLLLSGVLHTIYTNLYNIVIGKGFSSMDLGFYNRAYTIASFPSNNISNIIVRAVYPILCNFQNDNEKLKASFIQYLRMATYIVFPLMIMLCILAKPLVLLLLTDKWLSMVPLLQIMCFAYMWDPIMGINNYVINSKGRSDFYLKAEILKKTVAVGILIFTIQGGIKMMCYGLILYSMCDMYIISRYTYKAINLSQIFQLKSLVPVLLLNLILGVGVYYGTMLFQEIIYKIIFGVFIGFGLYALLSFLFKIRELKMLLALFR